ncbi:AAA family ATPase [Candidatus Woesearchaeota archaeon]|nr:AAA family ATPase [Candidatus Woesearchaeota archaeon]
MQKIKINFDQIVKKFIGEVDLSKPKHKQNFFLIFTGIPGSGKTAIAKHLCKTSSYVRVSSDDIKKSLIKENCEFSLKDVFKIQRNIFKYLLEKKVNIISDSNSDLTKYRNSLKKLAKKYGYTPIRLYLDISLDNANSRIIAKKQIKKSDKIYKKIKRFNQILEIPRVAKKINCNLSMEEVFEQVDNALHFLMHKKRKL